MDKVLLLGGTGAMGVYLVPELLRMGYEVVVTSRFERISDNDKLSFIQGNSQNDQFIEHLLLNDDYSVIVDFMSYSTEKFKNRFKLFLNNTKQYIFISSCRVFAESNEPITENTPRILDVTNDSEYLSTDEYALAKARQENILQESSFSNWTIIRPTITYSKERFQLGTLEADTIIFRSKCKCPVILPSEMLEKQTSMTWGGDVAKMIGLLVLNPKALGEDYNTVSHEHRSWYEIYEYYNKLIGLKLMPIDLDKYIEIVGGKYQILLSRMFDRVMDNTKILSATGISRESIMPIYNGLEKELQEIDLISLNKINYLLNAKIDRITRSHISLKNASMKQKVLYYSVFFGLSSRFLNKTRNFLKK